MTSHIVLKVENLSKRFFIFERRDTLLRALIAFFKIQRFRREIWALRNMSFEISKGGKLAVIGKNGSGKTTLLRIIAGIYDKSAGTIEVTENPAVIFNFAIGISEPITVTDNVYLLGAMYGISRDVLREKMDEILKLAELERFKRILIKQLSKGQQQRLALSVFFQTQSDFFIFDESTTFIDIGFEHKSELYFKKLFSPNTTLIMVSHDMSLLRKYCTKAIWLEEGQVRMYGDVEKVINDYIIASA